jgi:hypothetical protein
MQFLEHAMKRWILALLLVLSASSALAVEERPSSRRTHPKRTRGSYAEYIVIRKEGQPTRVRQVYSGYSAWFPPPAFLYYGYPHSGDGTGIGPLGRQ